MAGVTVGVDPDGLGGPGPARRKYLRRLYCAPLAYVYDVISGDALGTLEDMSPDGLRIVTERALPEGVVRHLAIQFGMRQGEVRVCRICATVARCHPTQVPLRFACGFRDLWMRPMDRRLFNTVFSHLDFGGLPSG